MLSLNDLAESIATGTVRVGERIVTVRALSAVEHAAILAALPRPVAPLKKDPNKGSGAPRVPDEQDPEYLAKVEAWFATFRAAVVVLACGIDVGLPEAVAMQTQAEKLLDRLPMPVVHRLYEAQRELAAGRRVTAEERGDEDGDQDHPTGAA